MYCTPDRQHHDTSIRSDKTYVFIISRESVIDTRGEDNQIILDESNAHPLVFLAPHIKISLSVTDISDFLVLVQMLSEEHLHLILVSLAHCCGGDGDLIAVLVAAFLGERVDIRKLWEVAVDYAERGKVVF